MGGFEAVRFLEFCCVLEKKQKQTEDVFRYTHTRMDKTVNCKS